MPEARETAAPRITCRPIELSDLQSVAQLLTEGFPARPLTYWERGLERMSKRDVPAGSEKFGYVLLADGSPVGVLLLIPSQKLIDGTPRVFSNVSSWYVDPRFTAYAAALVSKALRKRSITYLNVSPSPNTWPILEAQGYRKYCDGLFWAMCWLKPGIAGVEVTPVSADKRPTSLDGAPDWPLLRDHADYGCQVFVCHTREEACPFVFRPYRRRDGKLWLPGAQLIYARNRESVVRHAGTISRYLSRFGTPFIIIDTNEPIRGLTGFYVWRWGKKFYRGPHAPPLDDLAYTERALFGF